MVDHDRTPTEVAQIEIRDSVQSVAGVERAFVEGPPWRVHVVCDEGVSERTPMDAEVGIALARAGLSAEEVEVRLSYLGRSEPRRRVRFVSAEVDHPRVGWATAQAAVEWNGVVGQGEAEGESNPTYDLRLAASATVRALQSLVPSAPTFHVVGVKPIHVFDRDLIVVLIRLEGSLDQPLVGTSLVTGDSIRSASLAVLNALNRLLGNYLSVTD